MKRVAVLLNASKLGGAERSIILQIKKITRKSKFTFLIPILDEKGRDKNQIEIAN